MPGRSFIERAVECADTNALRMALYQATRDAEIAAITPERAFGPTTDAIVFSDEDTALIRAKAVEYLLTEPDESALPVPSRDEIVELLEMAEARSLAPDDLIMRHKLPAFSDLPYQAQWHGEKVIPEGYHVAIVGAGFAGIAMGVQLANLGVPFTIYERRAEVGGVWSINTYPDVRVDTVSFTYEYAFEKKYPWTEYFARQSDVRAYIDHVARKYGVYEHIRFGSDVTQARFDEPTQCWTLTVKGEESVTEAEANVVVAASGVFATPRELSVEGVSDFTGQIVHTARWNEDVEYAGKKVAVIGNGSTGVQLLSKIAEKAESVTVYQRTPQWISPRTNYGVPISDELQWLIQKMPFYWNWNKYVAGLATIDLRNVLMPDEEWIANGGQVSKRNDMLREILVGYISAQVDGRQDLIDKLIPDYPPMTRRPVVDNNWYASLTRNNVELVTTPIERMTDTAIVTADGETRETELVIAAVGFQTEKYIWPTQYFGLGGVTLEDVWTAQGAQAHLGMTVPGFPNMFMLYGPNSQPVASGAGLPVWFEVWTGYIAECIVGMLEKGRASMVIRKDAFDEYNEQLHEEAKKLIYLMPNSAMEKNYYVNEFGRLQMNAPWNGEKYYELCEKPDESHYDFTDAK
ncbi:4-hydroxyacetophenone monooxygenase [Rhodococcus rhodochrous J3]|uniref:4-hydroxyacetophenone monooxygenase n=1 Tax=Rhodococcus rhodochrous J3 TaxID=903528 RepID=A0ABY1MHI5_RHORH|nr:NAD(P)/FAD-dependent oxidoreductase [Rhodococcus rhodochrous]MBF4478855.1 NAD(P)/FAD-dependent oxidoreductase [Rhodococcus rhodochrous]MCD2097497.1 NAD(P)/FAD-dependent oxidoreductase [Rhodococcus rhodochrous]MCD2122587.1 NAD(P)/FAD-dependent oxidoreductase [Rhodococcus rhodochrous]MCQ4133609.1 NAD(P)/FAD-dependent oxidoreductase [Rhodococcus rhodochrous]MDJ0018113.1 NAD(P)/FAD-dependent oxidoreductase [Rhodococcus rhodochrous]